MGMQQKFQSHNPEIQRLVRLSGLLATYCTLTISLITVAGWGLDIEFLRSLMRTSVPMVPRTAAALVLASLSILLKSYKAMRTCAILSLLIGLLIMIEDVALSFGIKIDIIAMLGGQADLLAAPETGLCLFLSSAGLILKSMNSRRPKIIDEAMTLVSMALALLSLSEFLVQAQTTTSVFQPFFTARGMAFNTALAILFLNIGIMNLRTHGENSLFASSNLGGVIARRLMTVLLISPVMIQFLIHKFIVIGLFKATYRLPLALILSFSVFMVFTWAVASLVEKIDLRNRQLREQLEKSEENYRTFINTAADGIFIADLDGKYIYVNEAGCKLLGHTPDGIIGNTIMDFIPEEDIGRLEESRQIMLQKDRPHIDEWKLRRKNGTYVNVEVSAKIMPDGRWQGFVRDIEERKEHERKEKFQLYLNEKLSESLNMNECLHQGAELMVDELADVCVIDLIKEERLERVAMKCRGPAPTIAGTEDLGPLVDYIKDKQEFLVTRAKMDEFLKLVDLKKIDQANSPPLQSVIVLTLKAKGRSFGLLSLLSFKQEFSTLDFDFAKLLVERIALFADNASLYEEATKAAKTREDLMAIVSHDLKNPLSVILLSEGMIEKQASKNVLTPEKVMPNLKRIENSAKQGLGLISDLLINAKIEAGGLELDTQAESPAELVEEVINSLLPLAQQKNIALFSQVPEFVPYVNADKARVLQVLSNILGNAIKFTPKDGEIIVKVKKISSDQVEVSVKDNGPGIDQETLPHVFDRYWQPERSRRQGSGLGLSIAKGIVEAHGGKIGAESVPEKGSLFYFTLPISQFMDLPDTEARPELWS